MERVMILLVATFMVYMVPGIQGTGHLSFASNTTQVSNFSRQACGVTELCVETPSNCDPSGNTSCLFTAINASTPMAPNGVELSFKLSGQSDGYIAVGLTVNSSVGSTMLFICAQNNSMFLFRSMQMNNTHPNATLTVLERIVTDIVGKVDNTTIQCEFKVPGLNASNTRANEDTTYTVLLGSGTFDGNDFGIFNVKLNSGPLNLADPKANAAATTAPPTSGKTPTSATNAVLLLLGVLSLSFLH